MNNTILPDAIHAKALLANVEPVEWVIEGVLPTSCSIIVAAAAKTGKTYTAMAMSLAVARGEQFVGMATQKKKVAYAFLEDGRRRVARRFKELGLTLDDDVELYALFGPDSMNALLEHVEKSPEPLLVVLDPLVILERHLGVKDENVAMEIDKMFEPIRRAVQASRSTIVIIHHFRKSGDTMRGSVALQGSSDGWWLLSRKKRSAVVNVSCTLRDGEDIDFAFEMVKSGEMITFEHRILNGELSDDSSVDPVQDRVLEFLRSRRPALHSQKDISAALNESRSVIQSALKKLETSGLVKRPEGPKTGYTAADDAPLLEVVAPELE